MLIFSFSIFAYPRSHKKEGESRRNTILISNMKFHFITLLLTLLLTNLQLICGSYNIKSSIIRSRPAITNFFIAGSIAFSTAMSTFSPVHAIVNEPSSVPVAFVTETSKSISFSTFLEDLESDKISKVEFVGINPTFCRAYYKAEGVMVEVREGFPSFDDPKSPSGPAQAIAKIQHTPGVVCVQDISDALSLSSKRKAIISEPRPMLSHNSYPKEF